MGGTSTSPPVRNQTNSLYVQFSVRGAVLLHMVGGWVGGWVAVRAEAAAVVLLCCSTAAHIVMHGECRWVGGWMCQR